MMTLEFTMNIKPIKQATISEDVIERILDMIREKELRPGDKLPAERELSEMLQVSRPPLREALRTLAYMNIVDIRSGSGTYVTKLDTSSLIQHLDFIYLLDQSAFSDLLVVRKINEPAIAEIAASRITDEQLALLNETMQSLRDNEHNLPLLIELDVTLHQTIIDAAGNPFLKRVMESVLYLSRVARRRTIEVDRVREQAKVDHEAIVAAINRRDPAGARQAMLTHLENIERGFLSHAIEERE
jgi:GntR family transcriptional regulator, transcriptional repressor for pyruvate dehydrogenase complex